MLSLIAEDFEHHLGLIETAQQAGLLGSGIHEIGMKPCKLAGKPLKQILDNGLFGLFVSPG